MVDEARAKFSVHGGAVVPAYLSMQNQRLTYETVYSDDGEEVFGYYTDDNGRFISKELLRQALADAGFDGVIDESVNKKFGSEKRIGKPMKGMGKRTVHYIAFEPEQVKSAVGNRGTFSPNDTNILHGVRARSWMRTPGGR